VTAQPTTTYPTCVTGHLLLAGRRRLVTARRGLHRHLLPADATEAAPARKVRATTSTRRAHHRCGPGRLGSTPPTDRTASCPDLPSRDTCRRPPRRLARSPTGAGSARDLVPGHPAEPRDGSGTSAAHPAGGAVRQRAAACQRTDDEPPPTRSTARAAGPSEGAASRTRPAPASRRPPPRRGGRSSYDPRAELPDHARRRDGAAASGASRSGTATPASDRARMPPPRRSRLLTVVPAPVAER